MNSTTPLRIDDNRPELKGFHEFYATRIEPPMAAREDEQWKARKWALLGGLIGLAATGTVIWLLLPHYEWDTEWPFFVTFTVAGLSVMIPLWKLWSLRTSVKAFILAEVCQFFGFDYQESSWSLPFDDFNESGLLPGYSNSSMEDHFHGSYNEVEFDFFECSLSVDKGDNGSSEVYHGVLFLFSFPKSFEGRTVVLKDEGRIKNYMKGLKFKGERVELEDPRFEKLFEVWGTDPVEARYLLTPTFMERIVELANAFGSKRLELCFLKSKLLLSVHVTKDQFEGGGMFADVRSKERVETLIDEITRVFDIINTLKLTLKTRA